MTKAEMTDEDRELAEIERELLEVIELLDEDANRMGVILADLERRTRRLKRRILAEAETA